MKFRKIFASNLLIDNKGNEFTNFVQLKHRQSNSNTYNFWNIQLIRIHQARDWRLQNILSVFFIIHCKYLRSDWKRNRQKSWTRSWQCSSAQVKSVDRDNKRAGTATSIPAGVRSGIRSCRADFWMH